MNYKELVKLAIKNKNFNVDDWDKPFSKDNAYEKVVKGNSDNSKEENVFDKLNEKYKKKTKKLPKKEQPLTMKEFNNQNTIEGQTKKYMLNTGDNNKTNYKSLLGGAAVGGGLGYGLGNYIDKKRDKKDSKIGRIAGTLTGAGLGTLAGHALSKKASPNKELFIKVAGDIIDLRPGDYKIDGNKPTFADLAKDPETREKLRNAKNPNNLEQIVNDFQKKLKKERPDEPYVKETIKDLDDWKRESQKQRRNLKNNIDKINAKRNQELKKTHEDVLKIRDNLDKRKAHRIGAATGLGAMTGAGAGYGLGNYIDKKRDKEDSKIGRIVGTTGGAIGGGLLANKLLNRRG